MLLHFKLTLLVMFEISGILKYRPKYFMTVNTNIISIQHTASIKFLNFTNEAINLPKNL